MATNDYTYYREQLEELLFRNFPELAWNSRFIDQRSTWAAKAFEDAQAAGNPIHQCEHIAEHILLQGLHFSMYDTLLEIITQELDMLLTEPEIPGFALSMMAVCRPILNSYGIGEYFKEEPAYEGFKASLLLAIQDWIKENGLP